MPSLREPGNLPPVNGRLPAAAKASGDVNPSGSSHFPTKTPNTMTNSIIGAMIKKFTQGRRLDPNGLLCRNPYGPGNIFLAEVNYDPSQSDEEYGEHIYAAFYPCHGDTPEIESDKLDFANLQDFDAFTQQQILTAMSEKRPPVEYVDEDEPQTNA